jgi:tyrosyl-DNA phosphodiesterase 2
MIDAKGSTELEQTQRTLSFISYNVWFGEYYFAERAQAIFDILQNLEADFLALQEVTPPFLKMLLEQEWVRKDYLLSDGTGRTVHPYGVLMLFRSQPEKLTLQELPSRMERGLLLGTFKLNGKQTAVATVHLESWQRSEPFRKKQLEQIFLSLAQYDQVFLMGDFNFCSTWDENKNIDSNYLDVWAHLHPGRPGYTEDTNINIMRLNQKGKPKSVRFDRVLLRSANQLWLPDSIHLLGTRPIGPALPYVFPSDHFGLHARFCWNSNESAQ